MSSSARTWSEMIGNSSSVFDPIQLLECFETIHRHPHLRKVDMWVLQTAFTTRKLLLVAIFPVIRWRHASKRRMSVLDTCIFKFAMRVTSSTLRETVHVVIMLAWWPRSGSVSRCSNEAVVFVVDQAFVSGRHSFTASSWRNCSRSCSGWVWLVHCSDPFVSTLTFILKHRLSTSLKHSFESLSNRPPAPQAIKRLVLHLQPLQRYQVNITFCLEWFRRDANAHLIFVSAATFDLKYFSTVSLWRKFSPSDWCEPRGLVSCRWGKIRGLRCVS